MSIDYSTSFWVNSLKFHFGQTSPPICRDCTFEDDLRRNGDAVQMAIK